MAEKKIITTKKAPAALGPYSVAVAFEKLVFVSGQLGIDPATNEVAGDDVESQTRQALTNIAGILEDAGTNLENVLKTTVFLRDMNDFASMNAVYSDFFKTDCPARSAVQVAKLPKGLAVEIEVIAAIP